MSDQYQDNVERLRLALQDTFGSKFNTYYNGDPLAIPIFNLPCIIVDQESDETAEDSMGEDTIRENLIVKVVLNKRDDWTGEKIKPLNLTSKKVRDFIGRRDPETGDYADNTVKHVVRTLLLEGLEAVGSDMRVEYGINPRPPGEHFADLTQEGQVTFSVQYSVDTY